MKDAEISPSTSWLPRLAPSAGTSRILLRLVIAVLSASATTIAIAWGLAWWYPDPEHQTFPAPSSGISSKPWRGEWRGIGSIRRISIPEAGHTDFYISEHVETWSAFRREPKSLDELLLEDARGWPLPCLRTTWSAMVQPYQSRPAEVLWCDAQRGGGIPIRPNLNGTHDFELLRGARALPTIPIPLNCMINLGFWTLVWLVVPVLLYGGPSLRRLLRSRANRCPECNYDLRHSAFDRCSECGANLQVNPHLWPAAPVRARLILAMSALGAMFIPAGLAIQSWSTPWSLPEAVLLQDAEGIVAARDRGADPNQPIRQDFFSTPLGLASDYSRTRSLVTLLEVGADPGQEWSAVLRPAILQRDYETLNTVLRDYVDPNEPDSNHDPLFLACLRHDIDIESVRIFLRHGAILNPPDPTQVRYTPLQIALLGNASDGVIEFLIDQGADIHASNNYGLTALMAAAIAGRADLVRLLLSLGADAGAGSEGHGNAFTTGCYKLDLATLQMLAEAGADVHAVDRQGNSAPFAAVENGDPAVLEWLIDQFGFDINSTNQQGQTVLESLILWEAKPSVMPNVEAWRKDFLIGGPSQESNTWRNENMIRKVIDLGGRVFTGSENAARLEAIIQHRPLAEMIAPRIMVNEP